jgi:Na+/proline symporter
MATALGLGARALDLPLTAAEAGAGLVPPAVAVHLMGAGGGFLLVFQLFMAVTAAGSAEQIAVSSLVAYDVYRDYFNKKATGKQLVFVSRVMVVVYGVISGLLAVVLLKADLSLGWVYLFMGVIIGSAVLPIAFAITWKNCSAAGAISGAILGQAAGLISWLVTTKALSGEINLKTTGGWQDQPSHHWWFSIRPPARPPPGPA